MLPDPADTADWEMESLLEGLQSLKRGRVPGGFLTEVRKTSDTRREDAVFDLPKAKDIGGPLDKGAFMMVDRQKDGKMLIF